MPKVKIAAKAQRIAILNKDGYVSRPVVYSKISADDVISYAALNSGLNAGQLSAAMAAIQQTFQNFLVNGHSVELGGIGIFRLGVNAKMVDTPDDVSADLVYRRKIHFLPCTKVKRLLSQISFSTNLSEAEEDETDSTGGGGNANTGGDSSTGGGGNTNTGGDSSTGGDGNTTSQKTITLAVSPAGYGSVTGAGSYAVGASAEISASPNTGYIFTRWNDGDTNASRTITVSEDMNLTAIFATETSDDLDMG